MIAAKIEQEIERRLGVPVRVGLASTGREALAAALLAAGRPGDPIWSWPCSFASLTHSGDVALAVALPLNVHAIGIGVDLEHDRPIRPGMDRLICDAHERAWLASLPAERHALELALAESADPSALLARLVGAGVGMIRFEVMEPSLQQVFIDRVGSKPIEEGALV